MHMFPLRLIAGEKKSLTILLPIGHIDHSYFDRDSLLTGVVAAGADAIVGAEFCFSKRDTDFQRCQASDVLGLYTVKLPAGHYSFSITLGPEVLMKGDIAIRPNSSTVRHFDIPTQ